MRYKIRSKSLSKFKKKENNIQLNTKANLINHQEKQTHSNFQKCLRASKIVIPFKISIHTYNLLLNESTADDMLNCKLKSAKRLHQWQDYSDRKIRVKQSPLVVWFYCIGGCYRYGDEMLTPCGCKD